MSIDQLTGGNIEPRGLEEEMRSSYLDYAMSVIVGRALPDVRDGLKPVHRRVLYTMFENGLQPNRPYRKSATVVGDVMGRYHPHGDSPIYDTLVRLAQNFAMRYPLVDPQGNFGSIDSDPAAAYRYTEARLTRLATEMLRDIDADTVDFSPNYDESRQEPVVLPARFPNLLVNGSSGIAVGMATNIPPHNLRETIDATVAYIDDPAIELDGLMKELKGPDFPTGGIIVGRSGIRDAYETGRGRVVLRGRAHIEPLRQGKEAIVVTEMPYQVMKGGESGGLIQKIKETVEAGRIKEIADVFDYSNKDGIRLVIELKRGANPKIILNKLYKHTPLQTTFGVNMVALVDGVPRTLGLLPVIRNYVDHQRDVIVRRTKFELREKEARLHILEGLLVAIANIDEVIELIRGSRDPDTARAGLIERFELTRIQAQAILDLRLQRLTALQTDEIKTEHGDVVERIRELRDLLGDEARVMGVIKEELTEIRDRYGDERRTEITHSEDEIDIEDLIADQQMVISITHSGYIKTLPLATYRQQRRGGLGVMGMEMKDEDYIEHLFVSSTHDYLLFFTNRGKVYREKVYDLPEASRTAKGRALVNVLPLRDGRAGPGGAVHARLQGGALPRLRHPPGDGQEDGVPRLQHADQGGRHHRDQDPRRRRARRRAPHERRRRHHHGLPLRAGRALQRGPGAGDGPRHGRRARHERLARGQPGAGDGRRASRHRAAGGHRERLRQAHGHGGVPGQGPRHDGREDDRSDGEEGRRGRRPDRARALRPRLHLPERHGPADRRQGHLEAGQAGSGRAGDEPARGRRRERRRPRDGDHHGHRGPGRRRWDRDRRGRDRRPARADGRPETDGARADGSPT